MPSPGPYFPPLMLPIETHLYRRLPPRKGECLHAVTLCRHPRSHVRSRTRLPEHHKEWKPGQLWQCMLMHHIGTSFRRGGSEHRHQTCQDFLSSPLRLGEANADLKKQCPAVPLTCADSKCQGNPTAGCTSGGANFGCPCTGPPAEILYPQPRVSCLVSYICSDPNCEGAISDPVAPTCQNPASSGCPCIIRTSKPVCPPSISCSDVSASLNGCPCSTGTSNSAVPGCPSSLSSCRDSSCGGILLDRSDLDGSNKPGICTAASLGGCPCRDT